MAAGLAIGTATSAASGSGFMAAWFAVTGFGLGLAMPTMLNVALSALSPERSGSGSALMTAMRQVGATIGVAVLGTVLSSVYASRLSQSALPGPAVAAAKSSVGAGVAVAMKTRSAELLAAVHSAYAGGVDVMLWACAGDRAGCRGARRAVRAASGWRQRCGPASARRTGPRVLPTWPEPAAWPEPARWREPAVGPRRAVRPVCQGAAPIRQEQNDLHDRECRQASRLA